MEQAPTLLVLDQEDGDLELAGMGRHVAELMPHAEVEPFVPVTEDLVGVGIWLEQIRRFMGVEGRPDDLDSVPGHGHVHRHRRLDEAERRTRRPRLACGTSPTRRDRAHRVGASSGTRDQDLGRRVPRHVRGTGEVELEEDDIAGIAVAIGARVGALAGSEVLVSRTVKDLTAGSGLVFVDAGEHDLKGSPTAGSCTADEVAASR